MFTTAEEAVGEGRAYWPEDVFYVLTVREALLSDFFNPSTLWGDLKETMAERVGDDTPFDVDDERKVLVANLFNTAVGSALDEFAMHAEIDLSNTLIVEERAEVKPVAH